MKDFLIIILWMVRMVDLHLRPFPNPTLDMSRNMIETSKCRNFYMKISILQTKFCNSFSLSNIFIAFFNSTTAEVGHGTGTVRSRPVRAPFQRVRVRSSASRDCTYIIQCYSNTNIKLISRCNTSGFAININIRGLLVEH